MIIANAIPSKSGRLTLVPPSESDDESVSALRSHPDTRRHLRYLPERFSVADARARRISRSSDPSLVDFHIHMAATSEFVGTTGIFRIDTDYAGGRSCEVGILVGPAFVRGGIATDALCAVLAWVFEARGFHRAVFQTGADNAAMRAWLEKAGATLEGRQRECWADPDGGYTDVCLYAILEREWMEVVKGRLEARITRTAPSFN
ncbi:acyl-CoA N-acyltransferase [Mycena sp. CBHHK59/15]|nr:acyl-CoA N-acyltransferase [Mycena sp. CBHHK59/15]